MTASSAPIVIRCDASPRRGHGHLVRCLALAEAWRSECGLCPTFAVREDAAAVSRILAAGFSVLDGTTDPRREGPWLKKILDEHGTQLLVLDIRTDLSLSEVRALRSAERGIAIIDDGADRRLAADWCFYPPIPQVARLNWEGFAGEWFADWDWILLRPEFGAARPARTVSDPPRLLVTMGGSDPAGFTVEALEALAADAQSWRVTVVVGSGFVHSERLAGVLRAHPHPITLLRSVSDMRTLMDEHDLALSSFGMTAYELAARGVPAVLFCLSEDHAEGASALESAGLAISLGIEPDVEKSAVLAALHRLRDRLAQPLPLLIDGRGAQRIARFLADVLTLHPNPPCR